MTGVDQMVGVKVQRGLGTYLIPVLVNDDFDQVSDPFLRRVQLDVASLSRPLERQLHMFISN